MPQENATHTVAVLVLTSNPLARQLLGAMKTLPGSTVRTVDASLLDELPILETDATSTDPPPSPRALRKQQVMLERHLKQHARPPIQARTSPPGIQRYFQRGPRTVICQ
jgi:hypothetical protein